MARIKGPVWKRSRRLGFSILETGEELQKRNYPPGQHGQGRKKVTEYGMQLREKQKVRRFYGISESQMLKYFNAADKMPGISGENLLKILELRLDNVVYRMGLGSSRAEARQLVTHGHFIVNGAKSSIPSAILSSGDVIEVKGKSKSSEKIKDLVENHNGNTVRWIDMDLEGLKGSIIAEPAREDLDIPVEEHLIVELYSK